MTYLNYFNPKMFFSSKLVYIDPNKHPKQFDNAYRKFGVQEEIRAIIDNTLFKSGKTGVVFTDEAIYIKEDFESPVRYDLTEIYDLDCKQTLTNNIKFIINEKTVIKILAEGSQYREVAHLVAGYIDYIKAFYELVEETIKEQEAEDEIKEDKKEIDKENKSQTSNDEVELLKQQIANLQKELDAKNQKSEEMPLEKANSEIETSENSSPVSKSEDERSSDLYSSQYSNTGILKQYDSDKYMNGIISIRNNTEYNVAKGALNFLHSLAGNNSEWFATNLGKKIMDNVIYIREEYIDKGNVFCLQNDLATMHIIEFVSSLYYNEFLSAGVKRDVCSYVIREGLLSFYTEKGMRIIQGFINILEGTYGSTPQPYKDITDIFYIKLLVSNLLGKMAKIDISKDFEEIWENPKCSSVIDRFQSNIRDFLENNQTQFRDDEVESVIMQRMMFEFTNIMREQFRKKIEDDYNLIRDVRTDVSLMLSRLKEIRGKY